MDIVLVVLRLLHIVMALIWVGLGIAATFYIVPAAMAANENGLRFLKVLLSRTSYGSSFAIVGGITVLAGLLLYAVSAPIGLTSILAEMPFIDALLLLVRSANSHFTSTGNIVLAIGAVSGILAVIHGGAATGRATKALSEALKQHVPEDNQPISTSVLTTLNELSAKLLKHSRISLILMVVALVGMGSARYL